MIPGCSVAGWCDIPSPFRGLKHLKQIVWPNPRHRLKCDVSFCFCSDYLDYLVHLGRFVDLSCVV